MRWLSACVVSLGFITVGSPAAAETVTIDNQRGEKVKFCTYRSDDKSAVRPRQCWMLRRGQQISWNRDGATHAYDVRLFEPGAFELPICIRRNFSDSYRVEIRPRTSGECVVAAKRVTVPAQEWKSGDRVFVNNPADRYWYPATVLEPDGNGYVVRQDFGVEYVINAALIADHVLAPGSTVQLNWKNQGRWYDVALIAVQDETARIRFRDGTIEEALISLIRMDIVP